ncbi:MAG: antibiotic biosynthesis monooxygenase [Novosphingobium sp.]
MATCLIHMRIKQGEAPAFEAIAKSLFRDSLAHEAGMIRYEYWRGQEPNSYYCLQSFDSYDGFLNHETAAYHEAMAEPVMALIEHFELQWVDPVQGAAPLASTQEYMPEAEMSERKKLYAGMFPLNLADWWLGLPRQEAAR